jgi:uncharacterized protein (TIGR00369 family)
MPAIDFDAFEKRMLGSGFGKLLGAKLEHLSPGCCRMRLPFRTELSRGDALVHGGVIAALIDKAGTGAAWSYDDISESARGATAGMTINYLAGAVSCDIVAEGRVTRRGKSLTIVEIEVTNDEGTLIAKGPMTYRLSDPER